MQTLIESALLSIQTKNNLQTDELIKEKIPNSLKELNIIKNDKNIEVLGKTAQGGRSFVPWVAIMNKDITFNPNTRQTTVQRGYYLVLLFAKDGSSVHLSLNQGITNINEIRKTYNKNYKENIKFETITQNYSNLLCSMLNHNNKFQIGKIDLKVSEKNSTGYKYQFSNIISIKYEINKVPNEIQIENDINDLLTAYNKLINIVPDHDKFIKENIHVVKQMEHQSKLIKKISDLDKTIYDAEKIETKNTFKPTYINTTNTNTKSKNITSDEDLKKTLENQQIIGDLAEEIALEYYKNKVREKFGEEYAEQVINITKTSNNPKEKSGHGYGYDLVAFDLDKSMPTEIYIEVKGTKNTSQSSSFEITDNELNMLLKFKEKIRITRVLGVGSKNPKIVEIGGFENYHSKEDLLTNKFNIKPTSYRIFGVKSE